MSDHGAEIAELPEPARDIIIEVLCSLALSDHLGDVRDAESKLWTLIGAPKLDWDDPLNDSDSPWRLTRGRLKAAGLPLPSYFGDEEEDDDDG